MKQSILTIIYHDAKNQNKLSFFFFVLGIFYVKKLSTRHLKTLFIENYKLYYASKILFFVLVSINNLIISLYVWIYLIV